MDLLISRYQTHLLSLRSKGVPAISPIAQQRGNGLQSWLIICMCLKIVYTVYPKNFCCWLKTLFSPWRLQWLGVNPPLPDTPWSYQIALYLPSSYPQKKGDISHYIAPSPLISMVCTVYIYTYYPSIIVSSYLVVSFPSSAPTIRLCPSSPSFPEYSQLCCQHPRYNEKKCGCDSAMIAWNPPNEYDEKCCHHSNRPISMIKNQFISIFHIPIHNVPYEFHIISIMFPWMSGFSMVISP